MEIDAEEPPRGLCRRAELLEPVAARADSPLWQRIAPVTLRETVAGQAPKQATRVRSAWDEHAWRVLFEMDDARPWATLNRNKDPLWTEEAVEVFLDPVGDLEGYFEVVINPLGALTELVLRRVASGWRKNFSWRLDGLEGRAAQTSTGWCAELLIPFAALGSVRPAAGSPWRVNFLRLDRPNGPGTEAELSAWSPTGLRNFHRAERFGFLDFIAADQAE